MNGKKTAPSVQTVRRGRNHRRCEFNDARNGTCAIGQQHAFGRAVDQVPPWSFSPIEPAGAATRHGRHPAANGPQSRRAGGRGGRVLRRRTRCNDPGHYKRKRGMPLKPSGRTNAARETDQKRSYREMIADAEMAVERASTPPTWEQRCAQAAAWLPGQYPPFVVAAADVLRFGRWPVTRDNVCAHLRAHRRDIQSMTEGDPDR